MRALIFELDGTLGDPVYAHVFAWQRALAESGMAIDGSRGQRRIGMSGGAVTRRGRRERGRAVSADEAKLLQRRHGELFAELLPSRRPLRGAVELLRYLRSSGVAFGLATSGQRPEIDASLAALGLGADTVVIERCDNADNGTIVVALVDQNEVTLKRLRRKGASIALEPANPTHETRIFGPDRVTIQGRLKALYRRY